MSKNEHTPLSPLSGWGRYRTAECNLVRPENIGDLRLSPSCLARGLGRSYGDAALNSNNDVILTGRLNRVRSFDADAQTVTVEAGISVGELLKFIVPRGFFLPVVPGTQHASIGGCIAADIHGKNHHQRGTFGRYVSAMRLRLANDEVVEASATEHSDVFWATVGGMGLTAIIEEATLKLDSVAGAFIEVRSQPIANLEEAIVALAEARDWAYSVVWIDALGGNRGILLAGRHAAAPANAHRSVARYRMSVPFVPPVSPLSRFTIGAFNALRFAIERRRRSSLQDYEAFFFPLDGAVDWNRLYGPAGFVQYQLVVPEDDEAIAHVLEVLRNRGQTPFLVVLKDFGVQNESPLSFPIAGLTLAIDIPMTDPARLLPTLQEIDDWVIERGGRVYLAKDARLSPQSFRAMYPRYPLWLRTKRRIDPDNRFCSDLSRRLELGRDP